MEDLGSHPGDAAVTPNGNFVYVTNSGSNSVSVINTASNSLTATIPVGSYPVGVAITPNGKYIYVANEGSNSVSVINAAHQLGYYNNYWFKRCLGCGCNAQRRIRLCY